MLSHADAELVRRDPALPGLALLLDPSAFATRLRVALPGSSISRIVPTHIRYKPGTSCLVSYVLDLDGASRYGYAKAYGPAAAVKLAKRHEQEPIPTALGPGRLVVEDVAVVVHLFPDDHRLSALRRLEDPGARLRLLTRVAPDHPELWDGELLTVRYKPERRYVGRLHTPTGRRAALRLYAEQEFGAARAGVCAFHSADELVVPRLLGCSDRFRALLLEWLPGRSLDDALRDPRPDSSAPALVGTALAILHEQDPARVAGPRRLAGEDAVRAAADGLGAVRPPLAHRADELGRRLIARLAGLTFAPCAIHGDFTADQVLLAGGAAAILDHDRAGLGHPAADLGSFVASLERDALSGTLARSRMETFADELVDAYQRRARERSALPVEVHTAAALLRLAVEPFRRREPRWPEQSEALLTRAEELESHSRARRRARARSSPLDELARLSLPAHGLESVGLPAGPLSLRRAWPRAAGHLVLEYRVGPHIVAAQWLADAAKRDDVARATERAGRGLSVLFAEAGAMAVLLQARGADRRLPGLAPLLATPGASLVSHRAERRAVVRLEDQRGLRYAKIVRPDRLKDVVAAGRAAEALADKGFAAPSLLAVDHRAGVSVWLDLPGRTLHELAAAEAFVAAAEAAGAALKSLHASAHPSSVRRHAADEEARWLRVWLDRLSGFAPELALDASPAARRTAAQLLAGKSTPVPLHRDFHDKQVVLGPDGRVGFLDFDTLAVGEAALDLSNMLVHLELRALQGVIPAGRARAAAAAFLGGYDPAGEVTGRCRAYTDAARLRLACVYAFRPSSALVSSALLARVGQPPLGLTARTGQAAYLSAAAEARYDHSRPA